VNSWGDANVLGRGHACYVTMKQCVASEQPGRHCAEVFS